MNRLTLILLVTPLFFCCSISLFSQYPVGLYNEDLRAWLKANSYDGIFGNLGYNSARQQMYSFTDEQDGLIYGIYTGFSQAAIFSTFPDPINTEHLVPQSLFGSLEPMRSDLHVIRPSHGLANSARGVLPFGEVPDAGAQWIGINEFGQYLSTAVEPLNSEGFSELNFQFFEPREDKKGDIARQLFYFFTMYPTQAGTIDVISDLNILYQWHLQDPVDAEELTRNDRIESSQGNRNPYIDFSSLAYDAWLYSASCPQPLELGVAEVGVENVILFWQEAGTSTLWKLEYGIQGFNQGSGILVSVLEPSYLLGGLNSDTSYDFYVQSNCNPPDGDSFWSGPFSFTTLPDFCGGDVFTDSGGLTGNYSNVEDEIYTLCPDDISIEKVTLTFTSVDIAVDEIGQGTQAGCWDFLTIYNGSDTLSPVIAETLCGEFEVNGQTPSVPSSLLLAGDTFTSTAEDGCLTIRFRSDEIINEGGWSATVSCGPVCNPPSNLDVIEIGFGGPAARVNATWNNPNETAVCEVRGGRISPSSIQAGNPQFANINNTNVISQTNGSTVDFNIVLYNNPNVPFVIGQTYGYEVRCLCNDLSGYSEWSGITLESTFIVPQQPGLIPGDHLEKNGKGIVNVFPNPSSGEFINVEMDVEMLKSTVIFTVQDLLGRVLNRMDYDPSSGGTSIRVEFKDRLQEGLYLLIIEEKNGSIDSMPFMVN
jgi:hypothetical protein